MRIDRLLVMAALGAACVAPACAEAPRAPLSKFQSQLESLLGPGALAGGVVTERDLDLVFAHVRAVLLAAVNGSEPPSGEALGRRAEEIGNALRARGVLAALLLVDALEASARQKLRDIPARPVRPQAPPSYPGGL